MNSEATSVLSPPAALLPVIQQVFTCPAEPKASQLPLASFLPSFASEQRVNHFPIKRGPIKPAIQRMFSKVATILKNKQYTCTRHICTFLIELIHEKCLRSWDLNLECQKSKILDLNP